VSSPDDGPPEFEAFKKDIDAAERRVAGEIQPGTRALVVAILVFVLFASFLLPHAGGARGFDALLGGPVAAKAAIALPSRVFSWLALVFGVGFSMLALLTRRWALAWIALAGSAVASVIGMLAVWSRQTAGPGHPGPGIGLVVAWKKHVNARGLDLLAQRARDRRERELGLALARDDLDRRA